jgi:hypothetical protein
MTGVCHSKRNAAGLFLQRFPFDKINIDRCFVNDNAGVPVQPGGIGNRHQAAVGIAAAQGRRITGI